MGILSIHIAVLFSSVLQVLFIISLFCYSFISTGNICTCDTEENGTATCTEGNLHLHQEITHDIIIGKLSWTGSGMR